ncbi:unnamed protein product, partial [Mesorhabditis spiculigera]
MHFRFLNGMDCPDWLLAEMAEFSHLSALKFKTLCTIASLSLQEGRKEMNEAETAKYTGQGGVAKEAALRLFFTVRLVLEKAAKAGCSSRDLGMELEQLGVPSEHSNQLSKVYAGCYEKLRAKLLAEAPKEPSLHIDRVYEDGSHVNLETTVDGKQEKRTFKMAPPLFSFLLTELDRAAKRIEAYERQPEKTEPES